MSAPLAQLWEERARIIAATKPLSSNEELEPLLQLQDDIEEEIANRVVSDPADLLVQMRLLENWTVERRVDFMHETFVANLLAGVERLAQGPDAELIAAEREMRRLLDEGRDLNEADDQLTQRWDRIGACIKTIGRTNPGTLAGCAVKLRFLCDPEIGIEAGDREDDVPSLRQVLAFIEA